MVAKKTTRTEASDEKQAEKFLSINQGNGILVAMMIDSDGQRRGVWTKYVKSVKRVEKGVYQIVCDLTPRISAVQTIPHYKKRLSSRLYMQHNIYTCPCGCSRLIEIRVSTSKGKPKDSDFGLVIYG